MLGQPQVEVADERYAWLRRAQCTRIMLTIKGMTDAAAGRSSLRAAIKEESMDQSRSSKSRREALHWPDTHPEAGMAGTGPYPAIAEGDPTLPTHTIYRPQLLDAFGTGVRLPIVAWGNGGCANTSFPWRNFLLEIASHGFLVVAIGLAHDLTADPGLGRTQPSQLLDAIDWAIAEHSRPESIYAGKLATDMIAVIGQSCGGLQALAVSPDARITTSVIWNSGLFTAPPPPDRQVPHVDKAVLQRLHAPVAYFLGGVQDIAYANAMDDVARIEHVPLFFGSIDVGHGGTFEEPNGGEFGRVGVAWLQWQLMDDQTAGALFAGTDCGLSTDPRWQVIKKQMA